jgi:hypothetical protein
MCKGKVLPGSWRSLCVTPAVNGFFLHGQHSSYFEVFSPDLPIVTPTSFPTSIAAEVRNELAVLEEQRLQEGEVMHGSASTKEVSPRLQLTRWPRYLKGYHLPRLAALAVLPEEESLTIIRQPCLSLD